MIILVTIRLTFYNNGYIMTILQQYTGMIMFDAEFITWCNTNEFSLTIYATHEIYDFYLEIKKAVLAFYESLELERTV